MRRELSAALAPRPVELVSVAAAARLCGRSPETIRRWAAHKGVGEMNVRGGFEVSLTRLRAYLLREHGVLPAGLKIARRGAVCSRGYKPSGRSARRTDEKLHLQPAA